MTSYFTKARVTVAEKETQTLEYFRTATKIWIPTQDWSKEREAPSRHTLLWKHLEDAKSTSSQKELISTNMYNYKSRQFNFILSENK